MNANDIELALRARAAFNDSVERLDADTRRRLREVRLRALQGEVRHAGSRWMWPAGAALTAALALAVLLPRLPQAPTAPTLPAAPVVVAPQPMSSASMAGDNMAAVAKSATSDAIEAPTPETADPDMLSDLDFYGWLAKQPAGDSGG
jgi:hypothetical protein